MNQPIGSTTKSVHLNPSTPIYENPVYKPMSPEQQKYEEVRRKAWELYKAFVLDPRYKSEDWSAGECFNDAWYLAEGFCNMAKEKESENVDNK